LASLSSSLDFDPKKCKRARCRPTKTIITNGKKKCKIKKNFTVKAFTRNPPHTHWTSPTPK